MHLRPVRRLKRRSGPKAPRGGPAEVAGRESQRLLAEARQLIDQGDHARALSLLTESLQQDPTNAQAYRALAGLYRALGMRDEELQSYAEWMEGGFRTTPRRTTTSSRARISNSACTKTRRRSCSSFRTCRKATSRRIRWPASLYRRLGMSDREGASLSSWIEEAPQSPDAHRALAEYYRSIGQNDAALAEYQRVTQLAPGNVNAHLSLARRRTSVVATTTWHKTNWLPP